MKDKKANKIIAEYMNRYDIDRLEDDYVSRQEVVDLFFYGYARSLDALVPVWKRLKAQPEFQTRLKGKEELPVYSCKVHIPRLETFFVGNFDSMQRAAAIATAEAIQTLKTR